MSWLRPVLNTYLRWTEKPHLRRASPQQARRSFLMKSRLFFHAPLGMARAVRPFGAGEALHVDARSGPPARTTILYFHGGGFVFGAPETHAAMLAALAKRAGARAILPRYPLAPEHPYPAAADQALAAYHACLRDHGPQTIILGGDSAGGALALTLLARLIRDGAPLPACVFAFSPLTDLTFAGPSFRTNAEADAELPAERAEEMARMYLGEADPTDPSISPLFADFTGAPPVWITAGDTEILLDDSRRIVERLAEQGVPTTYVEERDLPHVWPIFHNTLPEARRTLDALAAWIRAQTGASDPTR
ncbi:MAG: alpha/beta hydrolase [Pseudomonadota bacterium]